MKIPDYKKRAAIAAENWKRLQAKKNPKKFRDSSKVEDENHEPTLEELIDNFEIPKTTNIFDLKYN